GATVSRNRRGVEVMQSFLKQFSGDWASPGIGENPVSMPLGGDLQGRLLGYRSALEGIQNIESRISKDLGFKERLFLKIWNSHGQLKWLKAHLIRELALEQRIVTRGEDDSSAAYKAAGGASRDRRYIWLAEFIEQHLDEGRKYPNPFFGGTNPLHLGLIFS
ncbi:MAG TPA: hypothetical protein PKA16_14910, partial [Ottowia sp.]|uniref:hypothetical protein n=1 Tax=Ottowia sp. TaxID=1898956 RepID=UPI002D11E939